MPAFIEAREDVTKQQYHDQAVLYTEALAQALGALDLAIVTLHDDDCGNYPNTVNKLRNFAADARRLAKEAEKMTSQSDAASTPPAPLRKKWWKRWDVKLLAIFTIALTNGTMLSAGADILVAGPLPPLALPVSILAGACFGIAVVSGAMLLMALASKLLRSRE
jgi:hypothetical protein